MSGSSVDIKGGGRVPLPSETEEALVSLLMSMRKDDDDAKNHRHEKYERRSFMKQLVAEQQRRQLANRVNKNTSAESSSSPENSKQIIPKQKTSASEEEGNGDTTGKVRIVLTEATFLGKSSAKKSTSKKQKYPFQLGTQKTLVFARSTKVEEVMKQAKNKLKMKKPIRCFVYENNVDVDLIHDLRGLVDGSVVFVSSQKREDIPATTAENGNDTDQFDNDDIEGDMVDPLDAVKETYRLRRSNPGKKKVLNEHPSFSEHIGKLPPFSSKRAALPAAAYREEILKSVEQHRVTIICGATGCGKSTQVPQFLLEGMDAAGHADCAHILVTQPRRVAAMSLAERVSREMNSSRPGAKDSLVGYNVRLDRCVATSAKIVYCTVGILLRMLTSDEQNDDSVPLEKQCSHLIIDEVHERDLDTDFCLTLLRSVLSVNKSIRVILMSATAAANLFLDYFQSAGFKPQIIKIPGRTFPVDVKWLEDCQRFTNLQMKYWFPGEPRSPEDCIHSQRASSPIDYDFIAKLIDKIVSSLDNRRNPTGSILIFLPGRAEIETMARRLQSAEHVSILQILRLHSTVPRSAQQLVFSPAKKGLTKVILATNVAETSITIPDVVHVIDTGRVKESRFNPSTRIKELVLVWTSQSSAKQRAGRAGRVMAGVCWRLYPETFYKHSLLEHVSAEIRRTPLDELVLQIGLLYEHRRRANTQIGVCPVSFLSKSPEPPEEAHVQHACSHLMEVGAIRVASETPLTYRLTPLGYHLSRLPMDAKVGKILVIGCILGCIDESLTIASSLSCTKSCFAPRWNACTRTEWDSILENRSDLVANGFGGRGWKGGTVKGDSIAVIACYNEWRAKQGAERTSFCKKCGLNNAALNEMDQLRGQFRNCLLDAGFTDKDSGFAISHGGSSDALLASCCLTAGLYPNIATLIRPSPAKKGPKYGRLLTKDGDVCRPQADSFQFSRVNNASENGRDAYAVYHNKHRSVGTGSKPNTVSLEAVNFVSQHAILLFGGALMLRNNAAVIDGWLKFKIGEKPLEGATLILALRDELDRVMLRRLRGSNVSQDAKTKRLLDVIKMLLLS